jgi:xylulokinase
MAFIGIDVGTSGTKVLLLAPTGEILAKKTVEYPVSSPRPMWSEQDPEDWWKAACSGIGHVLKESGIHAGDVRGLSFSGQMVGLVPLDSRGRVIRPCILWNDQRSAEVAANLTAKIGLDRAMSETSNPLFATFVGPKVVWMREHEPDFYARLRHIVLPKDYLVYRLTGRLVTEVSDASGTCLFNVRERRWSSFMLEQMAIPREWMPDLVESEVCVGHVSAEAAKECGLPAGTPVVAGGGDQPVQAVGSGIVHAGQCSVTIGTSGVVFAQADRHLVHPRGLLHSFCHSVRGQWYLMGVMLSAGGSFQWLRDTLCCHAETSYEKLTDMAMAAPPGCEGLVFLPYLTGERCPHDDPHARGAWIGLTRRHSLAHLSRSVMEGITFGLCDSLRLMNDVGLRIQTIHASGGAVRSPLWLHMLADVFGVPIVTTNAAEGGAFGAAMIAASGVGFFNGIAEAAEAFIKTTGQVDPDGKMTGVYADSYGIYRELYPALRGEFRRLSDMAVRTAPGATT